jgi:hypothetical protein
MLFDRPCAMLLAGNHSDPDPENASLHLLLAQRYEIENHQQIVQNTQPCSLAHGGAACYPILAAGCRHPYMPGKAGKAQPGGSTAGDSDDTFPLLSLPAPVLARIAEFGLRSYGHALLGVSRACRDAVLQAIKTWSLGAPRDASAAQMSPHARLLHRACCEASPGLEVRLYLIEVADSLSVLLQPGISSGGWSKVHTLHVRL